VRVVSWIGFFGHLACLRGHFFWTCWTASRWVSEVGPTYFYIYSSRALQWCMICKLNRSMWGARVFWKCALFQLFWIAEIREVTTPKIWLFWQVTKVCSNDISGHRPPNLTHVRCILVYFRQQSLSDTFGRRASLESLLWNRESYPMIYTSFSRALRDLKNDVWIVHGMYVCHVIHASKHVFWAYLAHISSSQFWESHNISHMYSTLLEVLCGMVKVL